MRIPLATGLGVIGYVVAIAAWGCALGDPAGEDAGLPGPAGNASDSGGSSEPAGGSADASTTTGGDEASNGQPSTDGAGGASPNATQQCGPVLVGDHESYHLPALKNLPPGVSAQSDWASNPVSGGWYGRQIVDGCRMHADGFSTSHGKAAVRVEVDPGDDPLDLHENSERAEMAFLQDSQGNPFNETASSGVLYYATSYYLPATWSGTNYPWQVFQTGGSNWPGNVSTDCSVDGGAQCSSWSVIMQFYPWGTLGAAATAVGAAQQLYFDVNGQRLQLGNAALAAWTDLVFKIDWSSGSLTIWRRDQGQGQFVQMADASGGAPSGNVYEKQGLYRGGTVNGRVDVLWIGPIARGSTFSAVEQAAYGTNNGP